MSSKIFCGLIHLVHHKNLCYIILNHIIINNLSISLWIKFEGGVGIVKE